MRGTRRFWLTLAAIGCLVAGGGLLDAPLLLVGAVGLAGWLLAMQIAFVRAVSRLRNELTVSQSLERSRIRTDVETRYTLQASVDAADGHLPLSIEATVPLAARMEEGRSPAITLDASMQSSSVAVPLTWETVGNHTIPGATVTVSDGTGLFTQSFTTASGPEITVESPSVGPIHIGQGGKRLLRGVGEHDARGRTGGLSAEEIRKYVPGDALKYVDWKATARLDETHVRNYEAESNRSVVLVLDHRHTVGDGPPVETKLDHLKAVAAAFQQRAETIRDLLGYLTIDDAGVTESRIPMPRAEAYRSCQHRISDLDTETETPATATATAAHTGTMTGVVNPNTDTQSPMETTLPAVEAVREAGLTDHVGLSNFEPDQLAVARDHLDGIAAHQVEFHPLFWRESLLADAQKHGYPLVAYSPLAGGCVFEEPTIVDIADQHDTSPAAVSIAWVTSYDNVVTIPKASSRPHLETNLAAADLELTDAEIARIEAIERKEELFPE